MQLTAWYLFLGANTVLALCLVGLLRRRLWREYPIFFAYLAFQVVDFLIILAVDRLILRSAVSAVTYRCILVLVTAAQTLIELGVLYELADKLVLSRAPLGATLRPLLRWSGAMLVLVAAAVSALLANPGLERAIRVFETLNFSSHLVVVGLLLVLLLFSHALQVPWKSLPAGVALGFGITAISEMASSALTSTWGANSYIPTDLTRMSAFAICSLVWLVYVYLPERQLAVSGARLGKSEMEFWDQEMQRMVRR